ncbi:unnamed protein product [Scytosiphon promiscuus]
MHSRGRCCCCLSVCCLGLSSMRYAVVGRALVFVVGRALVFGGGYGGGDIQLTICLPVFIICRLDLLWDLLMVWAAATSIMMVVPPVGWIRPHPYSDFLWNRRRRD